MILRHDNLVALVRDLDLVRRQRALRSPLIRLKDRLLGEPRTEEERQRGIVSALAKKLSVRTDDSTVTISVDWNDPFLAYELVNRIEKNFLEASYDDEVAMISDAVSVLQDHAKEQLDHLDAALAEYQKVLAELGPRTVDRPAGGGAPVVVWSRSRSSSVPAPDPTLTAALEEKRSQLRTLETERQRELELLQQQLMQAQLSLTAQHPTVIALQQKVDALRQPSPELAQLKREERQLMSQIAPPAAPKEAAVPSATRDEGARLASNAPVQPPPAEEIPPTVHWDENGRARLARSRLEEAIHKYQDVQARIDSANIELEIARTAFKYRYTVITPAEIPKGPKKPIAYLVAAASVIVGFLVTVAAAVLADRRRGRIVEEWQVRRMLKVELLGELEMPRSP
jgi:capsular polysaccharide biosynthesis protein